MKGEYIKIIDKIETNAYLISLRDDGITLFEVRDIEELSVEDIKLANEAAYKLSEEKPTLNLVILNKFIVTSPEVRAYAASAIACKNKIADAFVIRSVALKIVANFYLRFNKPAVPSKNFSNEIDAVKWLNTFKR